MYYCCFVINLAQKKPFFLPISQTVKSHILEGNSTITARRPRHQVVSASDDKRELSYSVKISRPNAFPSGTLCSYLTDIHITFTHQAIVTNFDPPVHRCAIFLPCNKSLFAWSTHLLLLD